VIGLVTGSKPFAGLPSNPAEAVLAYLDGGDAARIVTRTTPVSLAALPRLLPDLLDDIRPDFVISLGLALGAPVVRVETVAINACHFAIADNEGARPVGGVPIDPAGPAARPATWDAGAVVAAIQEAGVPAQLSFHAGTHLCNLTLYTLLGALRARGWSIPCGFIHLPYLPEQVVAMMRQLDGRAGGAPVTPVDLPSMSLDLQVRAVRAAIGAVARQAGPDRSRIVPVVESVA
jgi:pyroglutamyl-peptidase